MQDILELLMSNKLYMGIAAVVAIGLMLFIMKKVFKLFMIIFGIILIYGVFIYVTEDDPMQALKDKLSLDGSAGSAMKKLDEATQDLQQEAFDKVIDEVDKKLKKTGNK